MRGLDRDMKFVLVRPNYKSHIITPPLGVGYLASFMGRQGVDVKIIDGLRDELSPREQLRAILAEKPDAVGITCMTAFYREVVALALRLKENGIRCIIGGVHPTFLPSQTLRDSKADWVIRGEGEVALSKLIQSDFSGEGIPGVYSSADLPGRLSAPDGEPGARLRRGDRDEGLARAEVVDDLDELPFPDWPQLDPRRYPKAPHGAIVRNYPIGVLTTSRGCPYECTFCASPSFCGRRIRFRSPGNVVEEIAYLVEDFGVREVHFEDDNFTFKRSHVEGICREILDRRIRISWACPNGVRADKVDEEMLRLMKESGCYYLSFGIESANADILKNVRKRETLDATENAIRMAEKVGLSCLGSFVFGLPGETPETIAETIRWAKRSKLARAHFMILDVLPGSELWRSLEGRFKPNWSKDSFKEPEWIPEGVTREHLMKMQSRAFWSFYMRPRILWGMLKSIRPQQVKFLLRRLREYRLIRP